MSQPHFLPIFASLCLIATTACTTATRQDAPSAPAHRTAQERYTVTQLGFGETAHFGLCLPPACPQATPKHAASLGTAKQDNADAAIARGDHADNTIQPHDAAPVTALSVYFEAGRSLLDAASRRAIDALVAGLSVRSLKIAARTDSTGTPAQNDRVAHDRATAVARYLRTQLGLSGVPIDVDARALCCYVATNADADGRRLNRRVDIALVGAHRTGAP